MDGVNVRKMPGGVSVVDYADVMFHWRADGPVSYYVVRLYTLSGKELIGTMPTALTSQPVPAGLLEEGETYCFKVGAMPMNGSDSSVVWAERRFIVKKAIVPVTPFVWMDNVNVRKMPDGAGVINHADITFHWRANGPVLYYIVRFYTLSGKELIGAMPTTLTSQSVPAGLLEEGEMYCFRIGAVPANGSDGDAIWAERRFIVEKAIAPITPFILMDAVNVRETLDGIKAIDHTDVMFHWGADGPVSYYIIQFYALGGKELIGAMSTALTSQPVSAGLLEKGKTYCFKVGAVPANGSDKDAIWAEQQFTVDQRARTERPGFFGERHGGHKPGSGYFSERHRGHRSVYRFFRERHGGHKPVYRFHHGRCGSFSPSP